MRIISSLWDATSWSICSDCEELAIANKSALTFSISCACFSLSSVVTLSTSKTRCFSAEDCTFSSSAIDNDLSSCLKHSNFDSCDPDILSSSISNDFAADSSISDRTRFNCSWWVCSSSVSFSVWDFMRSISTEWADWSSCRMFSISAAWLCWSSLVRLSCSFSSSIWWAFCNSVIRVSAYCSSWSCVSLRTFSSSDANFVDSSNRSSSRANWELDFISSTSAVCFSMSFSFCSAWDFCSEDISVWCFSSRDALSSLMASILADMTRSEYFSDCFSRARLIASSCSNWAFDFNTSISRWCFSTSSTRFSPSSLLWCFFISSVTRSISAVCKDFNCAIEVSNSWILASFSSNTSAGTCPPSVMSLDTASFDSISCNFSSALAFSSLAFFSSSLNTLNWLRWVLNLSTIVCFSFFKACISSSFCLSNSAESEAAPSPPFASPLVINPPSFFTFAKASFMSSFILWISPSFSSIKLFRTFSTSAWACIAITLYSFCICCKFNWCLSSVILHAVCSIDTSSVASPSLFWSDIIRCILAKALS